MKTEKKPSAALDKYKFTGNHPAGICSKSGIEYNIASITEKVIEAMIAKGSPLFEKKTTAEKKEPK